MASAAVSMCNVAGGCGGCDRVLVFLARRWGLVDTAAVVLVPLSLEKR